MSCAVSRRLNHFGKLLNCTSLFNKDKSLYQGNVRLSSARAADRQVSKGENSLGLLLIKRQDSLCYKRHLFVLLVLFNYVPP